MSLSPGERLGPYEILAPIGAGGMGEVYRAQDSRLRRTVAIKILPHDKLADSERKRRFLQEARAASALMHPNIVVVYDISSDERMDFLVMEYVRGETLKDRIKRGALPAGEVMRFGAQISSALAAAHSAGIVHRDIKPANIMVTAQDSHIKVLDFGLAKLADPVGAAEGDTRTMAAATEPGIVMGTVAYMSPEQTRGEQLDGRSDIFSLGSVLYEAATGKQPFQGPSMLAVMHEIAAKKPARPSEIKPDLPAEFDRVIERALAKDKKDRYNSAAEMMEALQALETRSAATRSAAATLPAAPQPPSGRKWWVVASVAALVVAVGLAVAWQLRTPKGHVPDPQAYELYQRGRRDLQEFTEHGFKQSVVDFKNAIERDPEFAAAYAGLADAYSYQAAFELAKPKEVMPLAESNAARAIEKDPQTAEAYTALGIVALSYYWDHALARQRFERALKIKPEDAFTEHFLGHYYEFVGKWPEALQQMQRALDMDKLSPMYGEDMAYDLLVLGRNDEAVRQLRDTVRLAPEDPFAHALLAMALEATGKGAESLEQAQAAMKLPGMFIVGGNLSGVFCRLHQCALALDILKQMEAAEQAGKYVAPVDFAMVHLALGDKTKGMARMRDAVNERGFNITYNVIDPVFDLVREDPEFASLMDEMRLPRASWHDFPRYLK